MQEDFLFIVAEIASAFAGFASLVAVISSRGDRTPEQERFAFVTLRNVLLLSLLTVAFCLLPSLLHRVGLSSDATWRTSSLTFFVVVGSYVSYTLGRLPRAYREIGQRVPMTFIVNAGAIVLTGIAQAFAVVGVVPAETYLLGVCALIYCAGFGFVRLFVSLRPVGADEWA